jgi:tRNA modification GTPase
MIDKSTIYALSSGLGRAGIAVIRVSGPKASETLIKLGGGLSAPRLASLRKLVSNKDRSVIDEALVFWFPGPATATGEDVAEFHLHGSPAIVSKLFSELAAIDGVEPAEPGAFTRRAFDNGVLDLVEVEGLADLLSANTDSQRRLAMRQFLGEASSIYETWRGDLIRALALIDAAIDFVEEPEVVASAVAQMIPAVQKLLAELEAALSQSSRASAVRDGLRLVIAGAPNVGKSSLLNWLAGRDAAIVSEQAGTTRDVVEAVVEFEGVRLVLADTAGLRTDSKDEIEKIGMARAEAEIRDADVLLWLIAPDVSSEVGPTRTPDLVVLNKSDLLSASSIHNRNESEIAVSLKTGAGLTLLHEKLAQLILARSALGNDAIVVRDRHVVAIQKTIRKLNDVLNHPNLPLEVLAEELRDACRIMSSITGRIDVEDLLGRIFSEFCIGK